MIDEIRATDERKLKKLFRDPKNGCGPYIYLPIDTKNGLDKPERIGELLSGYARAGFSGVIPFSYKNFGVQALSEDYYALYLAIREAAESAGLSLGYLDDTYLMRVYLGGLPEKERNGAICKILCKYDYACTENQCFKRKLHTNGILMSLTAVNDDDLTILDLRPFVTDGVLTWEVPAGNWNVEEYVCESDRDSNYLDLLDYDRCTVYLNDTFGTLLERLGEHDAPSPVSLFLYRNVMYAGKNRRMWHPAFNEKFIGWFGFDPAPLYPLLYRDFGGSGKRYVSLLMAARARMLTDGYLKAVSDFCGARGIFCTGYAAESKTTACSWLFGDAQMIHRYASAPGVALSFAYLYGINGIRVAAGFADAAGKDTVTADLFNYYGSLQHDVVYRESMNAFVRGINMVFAHLGEDRTKTEADNGKPWNAIFSNGDDLTDYAAFVSRIQALLRGGEHVSEVGILYPIHTLHEIPYLYEEKENGFAYPYVPENTDYMELMNSFLNYIGMDAAFLHPNFLMEHASAENGTLYLTADNRTMRFKLLVLPSMSVISLGALRMIRQFFDAGGRILATDRLPERAWETAGGVSDVNHAIHSDTPEDEEVRETIRYIFGEDVTDHKLYRSYYKNENPNGGVAYFLPSNKTSVDGTDTVSANMLYQATERMNLAPDVYIDRMPRREFLGIVNQNLPEFLKIGVDKRLARACTMNCLHKRYAGCDIYFITNTTGDDYKGKILLRGRHEPEEWDPHTGRTCKADGALVRFRGELYTAVTTTIPSSSCLFLVSPISRTQSEIIRDLTDDEEIPTFWPHENF